MKLLAIDDDDSFLNLIVVALRNEELEILTASDATRGMELFHQEHPRIVLLDLVLPDMGGMDLLERMVSADPGTEVDVPPFIVPVCV